MSLGRWVAGVLQRYPLSTFIILVYGLTWPAMILDALGSHGLLPFRVPRLALGLLMAYQPTVAALIVTAAASGKAGVRALLGRLLVWRVGVGWYAIAILGFAVLCLLVVNLAGWFGGPDLPTLSSEFTRFTGLQLAGVIPLVFLVRGLVNGEEIAWRGFALPRLQVKWNALSASLIVGFFWGLFHLPLFWTLGSSQSSASLPGFVGSTMALSVLFTWIFNNTRGSVLMAYLFHASVNTWTGVFPIDRAGPPVSWLMGTVTYLAAVIVLLWWGPTHLSREVMRVT